MEETHSTQQPTATTPVVAAAHSQIPSAFELLREAWELFKKNWLLAIGIIIGPMAIDNLVYQITRDSLLLSLVSPLITMTLAMIMLALILRFIRGEVIDSTTLFSRFSLDRFFQYIAGSIALSVMVLVGIVLLILPGIYLGVRFIFTLFLIVDTDMDFMTALKTSWVMTKGHFVTLFIIGLVTGFILFLPTIFTAFILAVVTVPVGLISGALLYTKLKPANV